MADIEDLKEYFRIYCSNSDDAFTDKLMSLEEFTNHINEYEDRFRYYCEFLIIPLENETKITLAVPSHTKRIENFVMKKENISWDELKDMVPQECSPLHFLADKYSITIGWYDRALVPSDVETSALEVLRKLNEYKIIDTVTEEQNTEFKKYLYRKSLGLDK